MSNLTIVCARFTFRTLSGNKEGVLVAADSRRTGERQMQQGISLQQTGHTILFPQNLCE